jgi:hypothetical protein
MIRSSRSVLWSNPLATMTIAALALWGCGGGDGGGGSAGTGGTHVDGGAGAGGKAGGAGGATAGTGGKAGSSAAGTSGGTAGAGGSAAGTSGGTAGAGVAGTSGGTAGTGGSAAGTGGGAAGTGGGAAGAGGRGGAAGAVAGAGGGAAGAGGGAAGAGGKGGAAGGAAGAGGGAAGAGGTTFTCTNGAACALPNSVRGICASNACVACSINAACAAAYTADPICVSGNCVACGVAADCTPGQICASATCGICATDGDCVSGYGAHHLCQSGSCVAGDCRAKGGCATTGLICNTTALTCGTCAADGDCTTEYGADHICSGGVCISGTCHDSSTCTGGKICDPTSHECGACPNDAACKNDPKVPAANHICQGNVCVAGNCRAAADCNNTAQICSGFLCGMCSNNTDCSGAYGTGHVCVSGACISGACATSADCTGGNQLCNTTTHACQACTLDTQCTADTTYGPAHICLLSNGSNGQCVAGNCHDISSECTMTGQICGATTAHVCGNCGSDGACVTAYGTGDICLASGLCVAGNCHGTSVECTGPNAGKLCISNNCGACTTDGQCTADGHYGVGNICSSGTGTCGLGNCHSTSAECTGANAGKICGVTTTNTCGACATDGQCKSDGVYGPNDICATTAGAGQGTCTSATCATNNAACGANASDFCCGNTCTAGDCCVDNDCAAAGVACVGHTCSACNPVSGNKFYVDPVNGNNLTATGSDMTGTNTAPGCAFKTIAGAIAHMPSPPFANSQIIIVGTPGTPTGLDASDTLPITLPPNTTLTTTGGPITIALLTSGALANAGFRLLNNASGIAGNPAAPLTLDGKNHTTGIAIQVNPATATFTSSISNVAIQNTNGDGIRVVTGVSTIGAGVVVSGSNADGLHITGGTVTITNAAGTQTSFNSNAIGIEATGLGSVSITGTPGTPTPSNSGTVVASFNTTGIHIQQTAGAAGLVLNNINGLVAWGSATRDALFQGGSHIQVRNSVFGAGPEGIRINAGAGGTAAQQNDISTIDLGTAVSFGGNYIQTPNSANGHHANLGICLTLAANQAAQTLLAAGNFMTTGANPGVQLNCATAAGTIGKAVNCNANPATTVSVGNATAVTTPITETLSMCN